MSMFSYILCVLVLKCLQILFTWEGRDKSGLQTKKSFLKFLQLCCISLSVSYQIVSLVNEGDSHAPILSYINILVPDINMKFK